MTTPATPLANSGHTQSEPQSYSPPNEVFLEEEVSSDEPTNTDPTSPVIHVTTDSIIDDTEEGYRTPPHVFEMDPPSPVTPTPLNLTDDSLDQDEELDVESTGSPTTNTDVDFVDLSDLVDLDDDEDSNVTTPETLPDPLTRSPTSVIHVGAPPPDLQLHHPQQHHTQPHLLLRSTPEDQRIGFHP